MSLIRMAKTPIASVEQDVPGDVHDAYERLLRAGFDSRLIST
ncbi:hypothetical protein [Streptomyces fuscichromogenes]|nr:hypothetical protein [Streptomyces fuscichromogenes]